MCENLVMIYTGLNLEDSRKKKLFFIHRKRPIAKFVTSIPFVEYVSSNVSLSCEGWVIFFFTIIID